MEEKRYEELIKELEETVKQLEDPNVSLDEAISLYKKGIDLANTCQKRLENAKQEILKVNNNQATVKE